ncbi:MAG: hypothetical protein R2939_08290 [Kofleriaceae bacterium]
MLKLVASSLVALSLAGCVEQKPDTSDIARAIPTATQVQINLPGQAMARTLGELAPWYVATRGVTRTFNTGTAWVLVLVHTIVQFPVTSVDGDVYTWGPWDDGPLAPARYRLDVTALADGSYDWALLGQSKSVAGAEFEAVIAGNAVPGATEATGHGSFTLDFDAAERVNPVDNDGNGTIAVDYDLLARTLAMSISAIEDRDGVPTPVDAEYAYAEDGAGGGDMVFTVHEDTDDVGPAAEDATLRSRWQADGAGRADLRLANGDLAALQITASECWDTSFGRTYYQDSQEWLPTEGVETSCVFATADLPE